MNCVHFLRHSTTYWCSVRLISLKERKTFFFCSECLWKRNGCVELWTRESSIQLNEYRLIPKTNKGIEYYQFLTSIHAFSVRYYVTFIFNLIYVNTFAQPMEATFLFRVTQGIPPFAMPDTVCAPRHIHGILHCLLIDSRASTRAHLGILEALMRKRGNTLTQILLNASTRESW